MVFNGEFKMRDKLKIDVDKVYYKGVHVATLHHCEPEGFAAPADEFKRFLERNRAGVSDGRCD